MKKLVVMLLTALLVLGFVGCKTTKPTDKKVVKVGVAIYRFDDNFMTLFREELEAYFKTKNTDTVEYKVTIVDSQGNQETQTGQIDNFITQGVDVLIINPVQNSAAATIVNKAKDANIPIVLINREPENVNDKKIWPGRQTYVGAIAEQSGRMQGQIIMKQEKGGDLNGNGKIDYIMIIGDPDNSDARLRTEFSIQELLDNGVKVNKLAESVCNWQPDQSQPVVADFLTKFKKGEIDVIFCNNDAMAMGALAALEAAGWVVGKDVFLVGVDAIPEAVDAIKNGKLTGTVFNDHIGQSHKAADCAIILAGGGTVDEVYYIDYATVE